ncbi:MAG: helix-turn-helix transcriptional regulator [Thalassobium sp.]|nr:MAG: helix-turn-helix transcriptional regulator [Thalassobium sp.]
MAETDQLMVVHLRFVTPADQPPFVILLSSQVQWPAAFGDMLHTAFDLSPAEIEVVRALTLGQSLSDIADARERSIDTIRAQLKSVMGKTETRSQSELVRLTLSTMDIAQFSEDAAARTSETSQGFDTLEPRPFQTMKTADGRRLDYLILGDPSGKPCFFFPLDYGLVRWPASAEAEAARRGIKIIVPVRPGYGQSTPLPKGVPYVVQLADDMRALLDHLGIERLPLVTLGGDSFIAIAFHAAYPERLTGLICCAGVLPLTRAEQYERMDKWHRFILAGARYTPHLLPFMVKAGFALARKLGKRGFVNAVYGKSPADVATFGIDEVYEAIVCGSEVALSEGHSAHDAFSREVIAHETTNWAAEVAALRGSVPVIFLNGLQDPQVPPATLAEYQNDHDWIDFRIYPDAGQLLFFLKWRDVLPLIEEFQEG